MVRMVIDIEAHGDVLATKETVAAALEPLGSVRVVQVTEFYRGRERTWQKSN